MAYVKKGEMVKISSEFLKTVSGDHDDTKNGAIVYTLVPTHNNPQYGKIMFHRNIFFVTLFIFSAVFILMLILFFLFSLFFFSWWEILVT